MGVRRPDEGVSIGSKSTVKVRSPLHISNWYRKRRRRTCLRKSPRRLQGGGYCNYQPRRIVIGLLDQVARLAKAATSSLNETGYLWALSTLMMEAYSPSFDRNEPRDYQHSL